MPLDPSKLNSGLTAAFSLGVVPPPGNAPSAAVAAQIAIAYNTYTLDAISCAGLPHSLVKLPDLQSGMETALDITGGAKDEATAAGEWADAFEAYWDGALFGATGTVTTPPLKAPLESALEAVFLAKPTLLPAAVTAMVTAIDAFTKTVMVRDSAVPPPTGCGPAPIT